MAVLVSDSSGRFWPKRLKQIYVCFLTKDVILWLCFNASFVLMQANFLRAIWSVKEMVFPFTPGEKDKGG